MRSYIRSYYFYDPNAILYILKRWNCKVMQFYDPNHDFNNHDHNITLLQYTRLAIYERNDACIKFIIVKEMIHILKNIEYLSENYQWFEIRKFAVIPVGFVHRFFFHQLTLPQIWLIYPVNLILGLNSLTRSNKWSV